MLRPIFHFSSRNAMSRSVVPRHPSPARAEVRSPGTLTADSYEIAAVKRAFDAERHAIDRSGVHSKQISGLAEQVGHALTGLSPSP